MLFTTLLAMLVARPPMVAEGPRPEASAALTQFPLHKGAKWVYEGEAEWTTRNQVQAGRLHEVMEVLRFLPGPEGSFAAVIQGFPLDLAWYQPGRKPKISLIVCRKGRFFQLPASSLDHAVTHARILLADPAYPPRTEDPFLDLPLQPNKAWGGGAGREDAMYCWVVEGQEGKPFAAPGVAKGAAHPVFTAAFRTNADHMALDFAPGLGITGFTYEHHGAVARTHVRLVAYKP